MGSNGEIRCLGGLCLLYLKAFAMLHIYGLRIYIGILLALLLGGSLAQGQIRSRTRVVGRQNNTQYLSVTVGTGTASYLGDLARDASFYTNFTPQLNVSLRKRFNPFLSARAELQYYNISGSDEKFGDESRQRRNLSFRANNFEFSLTGQLDFLQNSLFYERYSRRRPINFFGFAGVGITTNSPQAKYNGQYYNLRQYQTEGKSYSAFQPVIPVGLGMRIKTTMTSDLLIEVGYRFLFTDYLDDVSGTYSQDLTDPIAVKLADRRQEWLDAHPDWLTRAENQNQIDINGVPSYTTVKYGNKRGSDDRNDAYYIISVKYQYTFTKAGARGRGGRTRRPRYK